MSMWVNIAKTELAAGVSAATGVAVVDNDDHMGVLTSRVAVPTVRRFVRQLRHGAARQQPPGYSAAASASGEAKWAVLG